MNSLHRFRQALASATDPSDFQNVAVDWWDSPAQVWRPSVLDGRMLNGREALPTHAEILLPVASAGRRSTALAVQRVPIDQLRPSQLITDAVARFFTTRYALGVLDDLAPSMDHTSSRERDQLLAVLSDLKRIYGETLRSWQVAFATGSPDGGQGERNARLSVLEDGEPEPEDILPGSHGGNDVFSAISSEMTQGELNCALVAWWDENERTWRPSMMVGVGNGEDPYLPSSSVRIMIPGTPIRVARVCGGDLRPVELAHGGFSLSAIPVLARDLVRMHDALTMCGVRAQDMPSQPILVALAKMLHGAAAEWGVTFAAGIPGTPPEPRVMALPPSLWGFTTSPVAPIRREDEASY